MRTIKFRAFILGAMYDVKAIDFDDENGITITTSGGFYNIGHGTKDEHGHLMQYTGLKDKNGVEICEGDKLLIAQEFQTFYGEVFYNNDNISFELRIDGDDDEVSWYSTDDLEVIGNIHEGEKNE